MTKSDESANLQASRAKALADYQRRGPVGYRLVSFGKAVGLFVSVPLLWLLLATLTGFYQGTGTPWAGREVPATAQVRDCERAGPVSANGFGYWWECKIEVKLQDGRTFDTVVFNSMVTPADAGRSLEFRAVCDGDSLDCEVGRPSPLIWGILLRVLSLVQWAITIVLVVAVAVYLFGGVVGPHRYFAIVDRMTGRKK